MKCKLLVVLLVMVGLTTVDTGQASAWLYNCRAYVENGWGKAYCTSHFNNGGANEVQVILKCKRYPGPVLQAVNGWWADEDRISSVRCSPGYQPVSATYRLR